MVSWILDPLGIILLLCYMVITVLCWIQFRLIVNARHKTKSIQTGLLSLVIVFTVFREIFLLKTMRSTTWPFSLVIFIYLMPSSIQFATFRYVEGWCAVHFVLDILSNKLIFYLTPLSPLSPLPVDVVFS